MVSEDLLAYIWKYQLLEPRELKTRSGKAIQIIHQGQQQPNAGPDFAAAKIRLDDLILYGSIELHISTKDWNRHAHTNDAAYNAVILHVVWDANEIYTTLPNRELVEVLSLQDYVPQDLLSRYQSLMQSKQKIMCSAFAPSIDVFGIAHFLERIAIERLERKVKDIDELLVQSNGDWNQVVFIQLARYMGSSLNNEAMLQLAKTINYKIIQKSKHDLFVIESVLFGQSGLLDREKEDEYFQSLKKEYSYQKRLHGLSHIAKENFKFSKIRPSAFPSFRIAQLASLLFTHDFSIESLSQIFSIDDLRRQFVFNTHAYWEQHFDFDNQQRCKHAFALGDTSIDMLLINFYVPLVFAFGKYKGDETLLDWAMTVLDILRAEKNSIISLFSNIHIKPTNALQSQALIELKNNYCNSYKCLDCVIGNKILRN